MKFLFSLLLVSLLCLEGMAQNHAVEWLRSWGNEQGQLAPIMVMDETGNIYCAEAFAGTIDFDPGTDTLFYSSAGIATNSFLSKFDSSGNLEWSKALSGDFLSSINAIAVDHLGNVYITGFFWGTTDFDMGPESFNVSSIGDQDIFLLKVSPTGNFIWVKTLASPGEEDVNAIDLDPMGNILLAGYFSESLDFDPGVGASLEVPMGDKDFFVSKYTSDGEFVWVQHFPGESDARAQAVRADTSGHVVVAGTFRGYIEYDSLSGSVLTAAGNSDVFVFKLDSAGTYQWGARLGGVQRDHVFSLDIDDTGYIYMAGNFRGNVDFDPSPNEDYHNSATNDAYLWKLNASGGYEWTIVFGGETPNDAATHVATNGDSSVTLIGYYMSTADFNPLGEPFFLTPYSNAMKNDIFLAEYTSDGNVIQAFTLGGRENDFGGNAYKINNNGFVFSGSFADTAYFSARHWAEDVLISLGDSDMMIGRWHECFSATTTTSMTSCDSIVSPSGNYIWTTSGTYFDLIRGHDGCDSLLEVNAVIVDIDTNLIYEIGILLSEEIFADTYQWVDCGDNFRPIDTETQITFTPTETGHYAVIITKNGCVDTSDCQQVIITNVTNAGEAPEIILVPNPTKERVRILGTDTSIPLQIVIYDLMGIKVFESAVDESKEIKLPDTMVPGYYIVTVHTTAGSHISKLILEE